MTDRNGRPQANAFLVNDASVVLHVCVDSNMEKKTGGYIAGLLKPVVEEVGVENIVAFCMDGGSNYADACQALVAEWPHIQIVPCATHVLDLLMEDVGRLGWAKGVVDRAGEMSSFVRNHHWTWGYLRTPELVEGTVMQALKTAGTRFGTQYITVSRLCALRNSLTHMVLSDLWKDWAAGDRKKAAEGFAAQVLDAAWWKTAEFFTKLMKLPFIAMRQTDGSAKGMMGRMYDIMLQITEDVEALVDADEEQLSSTDKQQIRRILKNREFRMPEAISQSEKVKAGTYSMVKWWQWNGTDAPQLSSLAVKVLSQPISASPCERGWSKWESVHTARRNHLGSAKCSDLVYVTHNWNVVRGWHTRHEVMPSVVRGNEVEPPIPTGYNIADDMEEEEGEDEVLADEYE
ncbi:unnamed protein product [Closterium sp. NIES-53]